MKLAHAGAVALPDRRAWWILGCGPGSDRVGEFGERCGDPSSGWDVDSEFVVSAA
jgi:hypothetical protein